MFMWNNTITTIECPHEIHPSWWKIFMQLLWQKLFTKVTLKSILPHQNTILRSGSNSIKWVAVATTSYIALSVHLSNTNSISKSLSKILFLHTLVRKTGFLGDIVKFIHYSCSDVSFLINIRIRITWYILSIWSIQNSKYPRSF